MRDDRSLDRVREFRIDTKDLERIHELYADSLRLACLAVARRQRIEKTEPRESAVHGKLYLLWLLLGCEWDGRLGHGFSLVARFRKQPMRRRLLFRRQISGGTVVFLPCAKHLSPVYFRQIGEPISYCF